MDRIKKTRGVTRGAFTRILTTLRAELAQESPQITEIQANFALLREKASEMEELNQKMFELMAVEDSSEQEMDQEVQHADEYRKKYQHAKVLSKCKQCKGGKSEMAWFFSTELLH